MALSLSSLWEAWPTLETGILTHSNGESLLDCSTPRLLTYLCHARAGEGKGKGWVSCLSAISSRLGQFGSEQMAVSEGEKRERERERNKNKKSVQTSAIDASVNTLHRLGFLKLRGE